MVQLMEMCGRAVFLRGLQVLLQVTAYQVIQASGSTGKMPTQVQFKISNPADQAVSPPSLLWISDCPWWQDGKQRSLSCYETCM